MSKICVFLDTSSLLALDGLKEENLQIFRERINKGNMELIVSHVQADEKSEQLGELKDYLHKVNKALKSLRKKGINPKLEPTMGFVIGISRIGCARISSEELGKIDDDLRREIKNCMGEKSKGILNIARDALIAISSLNHDYFVTSDRCLYKSWRKVIEKNMETRQTLKAKGYKIPRIVYVRPDPEEVLKAFVKLSS